MTEKFFDFILDTTLENFTYSQQIIFNHPDYHPYSEDLSILKGYLDKNQFSKAIAFDSINTLLSPRAHLFKHYALEKMNIPKDAEAELIFAQKIMEGISLTGDGTMEKPYRVTSVSDERDMLNYFEEVFAGQSLLSDHGRFIDLIQCRSERDLYFDITTPYLRMQKLMDSGVMESPISKKSQQNGAGQKKWWEFWK